MEDAYQETSIFGVGSRMLSECASMVHVTTHQGVKGAPSDPPCTWVACLPPGVNQIPGALQLSL